MYQYRCIKCKEPVSDELDKPILKDGIIIVCSKCLIDWLLSPPPLSLTDLTDHKELDAKMANELEAQFIKGE